MVGWWQLKRKRISGASKTLCGNGWKKKGFENLDAYLAYLFVANTGLHVSVVVGLPLHPRRLRFYTGQHPSACKEVMKRLAKDQQ